MSPEDPDLKARTAELLSRFRAADRSWMEGHAARKREEIRAKQRANVSRWTANNPAGVSAARKRRYRRSTRAIPPDYDHRKVLEIYAWADRLSNCLGFLFEVDHVWPLAHGGEHSHRNLQPLPAAINRRKSASVTLPLPTCWRQPDDGYRARHLEMTQET